MSINNFTDVNSFSISGLQNLSVDTINGNQILSTINIAGQTAYLSWDINTNTLTLLIPNATSGITGLLTSTDWDTFNNKENTLTFISPLRRVANTIDFDFSTANTWTGTQTYTNNIFYTGLPNATTSNVLYVDPITGQLSYGSSSNLLVLNNFWSGVNTFQNQVSITGYINHTGDGVKLSIGNFLGGDFSITDNTTGNDVVKVENDGVKIDILNYLRTGGSFKIINALTGIDFMDLDFNIAQTLFNTDMLFRGGYVVVENQFFVENRINTTFPMVIHRNISLYPGEFLYFGIDGTLGYKPTSWFIDKTGYCEFPAGIATGRIVATSFVDINDYLVVRNAVNPDFGNKFFSLLCNVGQRELYYNSNGGLNSIRFDGTFGWSITDGGQANMSLIITTDLTCYGHASIGTITVNDYFTSNNTSVRNTLKFTHFEPTPAINAWVASSHSFDGVDKPIIGNLGLVVGGYGACFGGHVTSLGAWAPCWINPFSTTYIATLVVTGSFTPPSDRRLKGDIRYLDSGKSIDFIKRLKPCIYRRIEKDDNPYRNKDEEQPIRNLQHGFIADEIEEVAETEAQKALVGRMSFAGFDDCKNLAILNLIPEIVQANKEMIDKIEKLETENSALEERLLKLENIIKNKKCIALI